MDTLLFIGVVAYVVTTCGYLAALWTARPKVAQGSKALLLGVLVYWAALIAYGFIVLDPWITAQPWLWLSAWCLSAVYLLLMRKYSVSTLGSFVVAIATMLVTLGLFGDRSYGSILEGAVAQWLLGIHIALAFIGTMAFVFAALFSGLYVVRARQLKNKLKGVSKRRLPSLADLDRLSLRSILIGFPFYTVALLLGTAQAVRQGIATITLSYVLATFAWVIYATVLQARLTAGWRGQRAAVLTICGLLITLSVVALYSLRAG